jgi:hypothetical protein
MLTAEWTEAQDKTFYEQNGLVVVECESVPPGDNWVLRSGSYSLDGSRTVEGHTGPGCYHFTGNRETSGSVNGIMTYYIHITNPGSYRLYMRGMEAPIETGEGDKANDCYIKMQGQSGCEGQFTKYVRLGGSFSWTFGIRLECSHHSFSDAVYDLSAGTHTFQIAGRSKNFLIDRFVLHNNSLSNADPDNLNLPESPTEGGGQPVDPPEPTVIEEPVSGTALAMGSTITLRGSGENLSWSYDANSDGLSEVSIGEGAEIDFEIPTGVTGPMEITIFLNGSAGRVSETYDLVEGGTGLLHRLSATKNAPRNGVVYSVDGRRVSRSTADGGRNAGVVIIKRADEARLHLHRP